MLGNWIMDGLPGTKGSFTSKPSQKEKIVAQLILRQGILQVLTELKSTTKWPLCRVERYGYAEMNNTSYHFDRVLFFFRWQRHIYYLGRWITLLAGEAKTGRRWNIFLFPQLKFQRMQSDAVHVTIKLFRLRGVQHLSCYNIACFLSSLY